MIVAEPVQNITTEKTYPRREGWNYIATPEEDAELQKLRNIRAALEISKAQFERGESVLLTPQFMDDFRAKLHQKYASKISQ